MQQTHANRAQRRFELARGGEEKDSRPNEPPCECATSAPEQYPLQEACVEREAPKERRAFPHVDSSSPRELVELFLRKTYVVFGKKPIQRRQTRLHLSPRAFALGPRP